MRDEADNQPPADVPLPPGSDATGIEQARELRELEEGHVRRPVGWQRYVVPAIAIAWSLFQLSTSIGQAMDALVVRCVHLGFAFLLVFLEVPLLRKHRWGPRWLWRRERIAIVDVALALLACVCALYLAVDHVGIAKRPPLPQDIVVGVLLIALLLEAARRVVGPALSIVALVFIAYAFLGSYVPIMALAFKSETLSRFIGQMTMGDQGIYGIPLDVSAQTVFLFVLFGAMLDRAGGGRFFIHLALSLLGGFRGGPAKAAVLASGLTGMVSGSSIANIVTTGTFTIPLMKKVGYPPRKAAAIEVAASTDGQLAPPIMGAAAFIIAEYVNLPYIAVVKAAIIPALASYAALLYITHLEACKLGMKGIPRRELPPFFATLLGGLHYLVPVGVLLWQLIVAQRTANTAAFHAVWTMALVMVAQRPLAAWRRGEPVKRELWRGVGELFGGLADGARNMVPVALACAAAGIIVGVVTLGFGGRISAIIAHASMGNIYLMLLVTAIVSLLIGMGLPTTATYIVVASLVAPAIVTLGDAQGFFVPLMAAHLFVFYFGILADDTPPVGLAAYAASAIAKSDPIPTGIQAFVYDIRTAILPFMFVLNSDLILWGVTSWPQGLLIATMACLGNLAFASATQGWFVTANRWHELPLLLLVTFVCMRPDWFAWRFGVPPGQRYWFYLLGPLVMLGLWALQRRRANA